MKRQCPATSCDDHTLALTNEGGPQLLSRAVDDCRLRLGSGARQRVRGALEIQAASRHGMRLLHQEASKTQVRGGWLRVQGPPCFSASCRPPTGVPKRHAISGFKLGVLHCLGSFGCVAMGDARHQDAPADHGAAPDASLHRGAPDVAPAAPDAAAAEVSAKKNTQKKRPREARRVGAVRLSLV